jgi:hypothetical protein
MEYTGTAEHTGLKQNRRALKTKQDSRAHRVKTGEQSSHVTGLKQDIRAQRVKNRTSEHRGLK